MGQTEVYDWLKSRGDWRSPNEIAKALKIGKWAAITSLHKLHKRGDVDKIERIFAGRGSNPSLWRIKPI